jgi:O-antigen ligase
MSWSVGRLDPGGAGPSPRLREPPSGLFVLYGRLIGLLLGGYLLFDKAFAYLRLPGTPLYVSEMVLAVGVTAALVGTRWFRIPLRDEPILALLGAFALWGLIRTLPGIPTYRLDAVRDAALWYYSLFAFLICAALARWPELLDRLMGQLARLTPWLLLWLPLAVVLTPLADDAPSVPFSSISVLTHKTGNAAVAALLALGCMWVVGGARRARSRTWWSVLALVVIALAATQNRGGLIGAVAGATIGLAFLRNRLGLVARVVIITAVGLGLASLLSLRIPIGGLQGRDFSADQLVANVVSLGGKEESGNLGGTVEGRQQLWTRVLHKQINDGRLIDGSGFGQNLAAEVGVYDDGKESLRNPHNSHLHILARMGVVGIVLWIALWLAWYWRLVTACRWLAESGLHRRRQVAVLSLMVTTAIMVSAFFDPQLEGPQVAALLWTTFGVGLAATTRMPWFAEWALATEPEQAVHGARLPAPKVR